MEFETLNKVLFEKSLKRFYQDKELSVVNFVCKAAIPVGENFTSSVLRVTIDFKRNLSDTIQTISVIVKVEPTDGSIAVLGKAMNLFSKEIEMFEKTLPMMYDVLGPELNGQLSSACLLTTDTPLSLIILEDLSKKEYINAPRQNGLNLDHCKMAMLKIAAFHASSVVIAHKNPSTMENYTEGIFTNLEILLPWMHLSMGELIKVCLNIPELKSFGLKLEKIGIEEAVKRGIAAGGKDQKGLNVLNHGDLWINNMLLQYYPDGKLKDLKLIDLQMVKYASPALDLHYFLSTSPKNEVRKNHVGTLLDTYYGEFINVLKQSDFDLNMPTKEEFIQNYNERSFYGLLTLATSTAFVKAPSREDATFETFMMQEGPGSYRHCCYTNDNYLGIVREAIPQLEQFLV